MYQNKILEMICRCPQGQGNWKYKIKLILFFNLTNIFFAACSFQFYMYIKLSKPCKVLIQEGQNISGNGESNDICLMYQTYCMSNSILLPHYCGCQLMVSSPHWVRRSKKPTDYSRPNVCLPMKLCGSRSWSYVHQDKSRWCSRFSASNNFIIPSKQRQRKPHLPGNIKAVLNEKSGLSVCLQALVLFGVPLPSDPDAG